MRVEGMTFKDVGKIIGVGPSYARSLSEYGERLFRHCQPELPANLGVIDATNCQIELALAHRQVKRLEGELRVVTRKLERLTNG